MGESSTDTDDDDSGDLNYENCIITHRDDSPSIVSSDVSGPETSDPKMDDFDPMDVTVEQVADTELSAEDTVIFLLALLKRIERYLNNLNDDEHKIWLQNKTNLLKAVLIKNCSSFAVEGIRTINGVDYVKKNLPKKGNLEKKRPAPLKNKKAAKNKLAVSTRNKKKEEFDMDNSDSEAQRSDDLQTSISGDSKRRCSHRLQEFARDREVVYCDRLSYTAYKVCPARFCKELDEAKELNDTKKVQTITGIGPGPRTPKDNASQRTKGKSATNSTPNKNSDNKNPYKRQYRSLRNSNRNDTVENQKTRSSKRRAASLGRDSKRVKTDNATQQPETGTGDRLSGGKRKLYSPDEWLGLINSRTQISNK